MSISLDLAPFFTQLNAFLPVFVGIFAVIGGIAAAIALSKYIISTIIKAFSGKNLEM